MVEIKQELVAVERRAREARWPSTRTYRRAVVCLWVCALATFLVVASTAAVLTNGIPAYAKPWAACLSALGFLVVVLPFIVGLHGLDSRELYINTGREAL
jgi:hypothetical protein